MSILETLDELKIEYQILKHNLVNTIEEALKENIPGRIDGIECKSLFLKNKQNYYLYFLEGDVKADLQELASFLHEPKLRFAPEEDLQGILGLDSGSVTPLGVINDKDRMVTVVISGSLKDKRVLVHPDSNDTTVSIRFDDLVRYIEFTKHVYLLV